jgi:E3 ubiquitin-protein ligase UBR7
VIAVLRAFRPEKRHLNWTDTVDARDQLEDAYIQYRPSFTRTMSVLEPGKTVSMHDIIRQQAELEEDAAEAIPFAFSSCTFGNNSIHEAKQPLYSCLSCRPHPLQDKDRAGICAGCSVSCHGDCELVELFSRRDFVCDCGTSKIPGKKCSLTLRQDDTPSASNKYDANFDGIFCACQTRYDPETE